MKHPHIEHDIDVFDQIESKGSIPRIATPGRARALPREIDVEEESGPANGPGPGTDAPSRNLDLITDPRRLPGDQISASGSSLGSGSFGSPAANAKILEVPLTLDASALEEGKQIRIVLSLTVKR